MTNRKLASELRVELPDGNWAELREASDLNVDDEVAVRDAVPLTLPGQREVAAAEAEDRDAKTVATTATATLMEIAMLARVITSWSLEAKPITPASIRSLPLAYFRPLKKAVVPHMKELRDDPNSPAGT